MSTSDVLLNEVAHIGCGYAVEYRQVILIEVDAIFEIALNHHLPVAVFLDIFAKHFLEVAFHLVELGLSDAVFGNRSHGGGN